MLTEYHIYKVYTHLRRILPLCGTVCGRTNFAHAHSLTRLSIYKYRALRLTGHCCDDCDASALLGRMPTARASAGVSISPLEKTQTFWCTEISLEAALIVRSARIAPVPTGLSSTASLTSTMPALLE